jgi:prepilin-type N-terminal cleavage/methylation domain-containing protein
MREIDDDCTSGRSREMTMQTLKHKQHRQGFTLVEILIVVIIIGMLAMIAWPNYIKYRSRAQVSTCINNLQKIEGAKAQWAFDNRKDNDSIPVMDDLAPFLQHDTSPSCPADGTYRPRRVSKVATCTLVNIGHVLSNLNGDDPTVD